MRSVRRVRHLSIVAGKSAPEDQGDGRIDCTVPAMAATDTRQSNVLTETSKWKAAVELMSILNSSRHSATRIGQYSQNGYSQMVCFVPFRPLAFFRFFRLFLLLVNFDYDTILSFFMFAQAGLV